VITPVRRRADHSASEGDFINIRFEYSEGGLNRKSLMALKEKEKGIVRSENET
jgi:hypothetical protein